MLPHLSEEDVVRALRFYSESAVHDARRRNLIPYDLKKGWEQPVLDRVVGHALCLCHAAIESNTTPPSIELPDFMKNDLQQLQQLSLSTSPQTPWFIDFFNRWTALVPRIKLLAQEDFNYLEHLICNPYKPSPSIPSPTLSPWLFPRDNSTLTEVHEISMSLESIASDILNRRTNDQPLHISTQFGPPTSSETLYTSMSSAPLTPGGSSYTSPRSSSGLGLGSSIYASPPSASEPSLSGDMPMPSAINPGQLHQDRFIGGIVPRSMTAPALHFNDASPPPYISPTRWSGQPLFRSNTFTPGYHSQSGTDDSTGRTEMIVNIISSNMPILDVIHNLSRHGCRNISPELDLRSCETVPRFRGGCSDVYFGRLTSGTPVAIKTIFRRGSSEQERKHLKHTARELHIWSKCDHPCIARLLGLAEFRDQIAMVSLWMENGHLRSYINNNPGVDPFNLCSQVADGLAYLHFQGVVHGDLKGPNVLISDEGTAVLIDFGNAAMGESTLQFTATATNQSITARWTAPEIVEGGKHSAEGDVYALGMTILETFTGRVPYPEKNLEVTVINVITQRKLPDRPYEAIPNTRWGEALWKLLLRCWMWDPRQRPTALQVRDELQRIRNDEVPNMPPY